ncbi:hypothetical protein SAMD00023353_9600260 [Rosellinia necatrix]|uniref:Clr5 domain-containing protein n=1 Tax=Rosellinia necatrix TaxID=77044 RepID=A0A1W2TVM7_ROSNE|nr:hypothetical protein SAMD00023353_9600260 [Rosellinia necatrix]
MDPIFEELYPQLDQDKYLHIVYKDRWGHLRPIITELYTGSDRTGGKAMTLDQVVDFMKAKYSFHATPAQYRNHLKSWEIGKRVTKDMKNSARDALARRKRPATSTSQVIIAREGRDQQMQPHKLMRHLKDQSRRRCVETIVPGILSSFNLPYEAFVASISSNGDGPSPSKLTGSTPENLKIESPTPLSPGHEVTTPSPNMQLVYQKAKEHRAMLFLQGRLEQLVGAMDREDRKLFVQYFHDFYINSIRMAREWGRQPENRRTMADPIYFSQRSSIDVPSYHSGLASSPMALEPLNHIDISTAPTQLCNWSIHVPHRVVEDDGSWSMIPLEAQIQPQPTTSSFTDELHGSILSGTFTKVSTEDLPFARDIIMDAITSERPALELDAWKLAIMAGNPELLSKLLKDNYGRVPDGIEKIHPLHLAASFLNGGSQCCKVFEALLFGLQARYVFSHNTDDQGHTILDALMVSILRSHTKISPGSVSHAFRSGNRFPGEEMDICGRWAPETPRVRELFQQGYYRVPNTWKHPFCHTSVQAICHSIIAIYTPTCAPNINKMMSGLFIRRCTQCGMELKLGPLHSLVVTTFYLASSGIMGETLFGAIAVLLCLLNLGADATMTANISVEDILDSPEIGKCCHTDMSPGDLMERVPKEIIDDWANDCKVGWGCFAEILSRAKKHGHPQPDADPDIDEPELSEVDSDTDCCVLGGDIHDDWLHIKCHDADMGLLWAAIQTEFLTYRRINEGDFWISENFSPRALKVWLSGDSAEFHTPLVTNQMMREYSRCGWFTKTRGFPLIRTAQEVSASYFMNMDIYERATYTQIPDLSGLWESLVHT